MSVGGAFRIPFVLLYFRAFDAFLVAFVVGIIASQVCVLLEQNIIIVNIHSGSMQILLDLPWFRCYGIGSRKRRAGREHQRRRVSNAHPVPHVQLREWTWKSGRECYWQRVRVEESASGTEYERERVLLAESAGGRKCE